MDVILKVYWGGKYIGTPISEIQDPAWLRWCVKNMKCLNHRYRQAMKDQIEKIVYQSA